MKWKTGDIHTLRDGRSIEITKTNQIGIFPIEGNITNKDSGISVMEYPDNEGYFYRAPFRCEATQIESDLDIISMFKPSWEDI